MSAATSRTRARQGKPQAASPEAGGDDAALHLFFGGDEYLVDQNSRALVNRLCPPAEQAFGLEIVEARADHAAEAASAVQRCIEGVRTPGFLGGRKVVWLKDANFFGKSKTGDAQDTKTAVEQLVELIRGGLSSGQALVVSAGKVDRRSAFFKACEAGGCVREYALPEKGYEVEQHARETAAAAFRQAGLSARADVIEEFIGRTGSDSRQIAQEVEKLATFLGGRSEVRTEDIRALVGATREAGVFDLAEAVGNRDMNAALGALRQLLYQGESAVGLIVGLQSLFRELVVFRESMDRGWLRLRREGYRVSTDWSSSPEAEAVLGALPRDPRAMHWYRASKLAGQAERFSADELARLQAVALRTHETMFSSSLPPGMLMEFLVLKLLGNGNDRTPERRRRTS